MAISDFLTRERVIIRNNPDKEEILDELIHIACAAAPFLDMEEVKKRIEEREEDVSTHIERGIAVPHAIVEDTPSSILAVGLCREGVEWEKQSEERVYLVVLLLGSRMSHLSVLSEVAGLLKNESDYHSILTASTEREVFEILTRHDYRPSEPIPDRNADASQVIFENAWDIARAVGGKVVLHADAVLDTDYIIRLVGDTETIVVTTDTARFPDTFFSSHKIFEIPFKGVRRSVHVQFSLLFLLSTRFLKAGEVVVNVFGIPESGLYDSIRITYTDESFDFTFPLQAEGVGHEFGRHILTRVLQLAGELAREGREGKPVGALFVVGDHEKVKPYTRQLIVNPFNGYDEQQRNIIDPSLDETVKEFAKIDGAFVIRDDGVILSCGTYITGTPKGERLHSGLGARHAAALSITTVTGAFAVTISESTRKITVFHAGQRIVEM
ncbi:MAG: PTS sugar transporter subunit IIA [Sediminispirochaetaceae bacterium]